jgi:2-amino-4-hydroxy-6-hydroxymethyldihydropteridine diphosphokinase
LGFSINNVAYIGIGSNVGVQINKIDLAVEMIDKNGDCEVLSVSSVYETKPYGEVKQEDFFNSVIKINTNLKPKDLFHFLKKVEKDVGRQETVKWGPREIDLDILFYNDLIYSDDELKIPHKDLINRDFVLVPLNEIAPDLMHPELHKKISEISIFQLKNDESFLQTKKSHIIRKIPHKIIL